MANLTKGWTKYAEANMTNLSTAKLRLYAKYNSQSVANNSSSVSIELRIYCSSGTNFHCYTHSASFNGAFSDSVSVGSYYHGWESGTETVVLSATKDISHSSDGTKSFSVGGDFSCSAGVGGSISSVSLTLPTIPRYFSSMPQLTITSIEETNLVYKWSTSEPCDQVRFGYKLPGETTYTYRSQDVKTYSSPYPKGKENISVTGLVAGATYDFILECRRQDSQLPSTSNPIKISTYAYPTVSAIATQTIGLPGAPITDSTVFAQTITIANPLSRSGITVTAATVGTSESHTWTVGSISGTSATINLKVKEMYHALGSTSKRGAIKYYCTYNNINTSEINGEFVTIEANCKPVIASGDVITYENNTDVHKTLLGTDQYIIQGKSAIAIHAPEYILPANTYSEIDHYEWIWNNSQEIIRSDGEDLAFGSINDGANVSLKVRVVDKRGYVSDLSSEKTILVLPYASPTLIMKCAREGTYDQGKGTITITAKRSALLINNVDKNYWAKRTENNHHYIGYTISPTADWGTTTPKFGTGGYVNNENAYIENLPITGYGLDPQTSYTVTFYIQDALTVGELPVTGKFEQADSIYDFNISAKAIGIGAVVNMDGVATGLHAHGVHITDSPGVNNSSEITTSTVILGKTNSQVNLNGNTIANGYATLNADNTISVPITNKTGGTVTSTSKSFSAETTKNSLTKGEIYIGGANEEGKVYLYNGNAYIPIIWYQKNS